MEPLRRMSISELAAEHLRTGLRSGRWGEILPGVARLAQDLDVSRHTLRTALRLLETEGVLSARGLGRSRSVTAVGASIASQRPLRVAILRHDASLTDDPKASISLIQMIHLLEAAGHAVVFCKKSQIEFKHDVPRLSRQLETAGADAWIVESGSRPLLEWCASQRTPCLALYGRATHQPLASVGVNAESAFRAATRQLLALGHRRIVLLVREPVRRPTPGLCARAFLEELSMHGIQSNNYNLPDWEESPEGFSRLLGNLFKSTPPTALIIDETQRVIAALAFLARRGLKVPEHVSLIYSDHDPLFDWCQPPIAHMRWDPEHIIRRVVRWVEAVRKCKNDRKVILFPVEFIPGDSIGPVCKG